VSNLVKIDKEMRLWEWRHTDRHTDWQTQTDFIICPTAICYSYGTDKRVYWYPLDFGTMVSFRPHSDRRWV